MSISSQPKKKSNTTLIIVCILISIIVVIGYARTRGSSSDTPHVPSDMDAWYDCKNFVQQSLKAPSTAQFPSMNEAVITHLTSDRWSVSSYVDAQNSFGAQLRSTFSCEISYNWTQATLRKLRIGDQTLPGE